MPFLGTIVNFFVVFAGGILGSLMKRGVNKKVSDAIVWAMGACVIFIGIDGALEAAPPVSESSFFSAGLIKMLVMIVSMGVGTLLGEIVDFDDRVNALGDFLAKKLGGGEGSNFSSGFAQCSILFCVGAMAVNGAFSDALGKPDILLAKSVIDGIMCFMMATTLGIGCAFSAFAVLAYQGTLTLLGYFLTDALPGATVTYMSVTGSLIIMLIGTNLLGITKVKTANMIPAIFLPIAVAPLMLLFT